MSPLYLLLLLFTIWSVLSTSFLKGLHNEDSHSSTPQNFSGLLSPVTAATHATSEEVTESNIPSHFKAVHFATTDFIACSRDGLKPHLNVTLGKLTYKGVQAGERVVHCTIIIQVPENYVLRFKVQSKLQHHDIYITDMNGTLLLKANNFARIAASVDRYTFSSKASFQFSLTSNMGKFFSLTFEAVPVSARPRLIEIPLSPDEGYIQSSAFKRGLPHPGNMDYWLHVKGSDDHVVLIALKFLDLGGSCRYNWAGLYRENLLQSKPEPHDLIWRICGRLLPNGDRFEMTRFIVHYQIGPEFRLSPGSGFVMWFLFLPGDKAPSKVGSRWLCTVPGFERYRQHFFPCNYRSDCLGGEDEVGCPYYTDACPSGSVSLEGQCYKVLFPEKPLSWKDAMNQCRKHGATLPVLNTMEGWMKTVDLVWKYLNVQPKTSFFSRAVSSIPLGLISSTPGLPHMYSKLHLWWDGTVAYNSPYRTYYTVDLPACLYISSPVFHTFLSCQMSINMIAVFCQLENGTEKERRTRIRVNKPENKWMPSIKFFTCPDEHITHSFLACDVGSACWSRGVGIRSECRKVVPPYLPHLLFTCANHMQRIPYTFLCNYQSECSDHSDEDFCIFPACSVPTEWNCGNGQCITSDQRCDDVLNCLNGNDEKIGCKIKTAFSSLPVRAVPLKVSPLKVDLFKNGKYKAVPYDNDCPDTHFLCPSSRYCLPVFVRCNNVYDCPDREDEFYCDSYRCPGYFRCRNSRICLHRNHICDGFFQCPQNDDEMLCHFVCPNGCTCYGGSLFCQRLFSVYRTKYYRFIDAKGTGMTVDSFKNQKMLTYLDLEECGITVIHEMDFPNLLTLNLKRNKLTYFVNNSFSVRVLPNLRVLSLAGNPLVQPLIDLAALSVTVLEILDLSDVTMPDLDLSNITDIRNLQELNFSRSGVQWISEAGFKALVELRVLDLRGCPVVTFPPEVYRHLSKLQYVYAENYKLCCTSILPVGFKVHKCQAPPNEFSSCDNLLPSVSYFYILTCLAVLTLLGNLGSFVYRLKMDSRNAKLGFNVFVTHLCVSDSLMGVYLALIGVADLWYRDSYIWRDSDWKMSSVCKMAGFLSLTSCEVSQFIICLITVDRCLVLRFPLSRVHFRPGTAHVSCFLAWGVGLLLAAVPLFPSTSSWHFYSQTAICLPLPITRKTSAAHKYSFAVMIVLNFVACLMTAVGQLLIYYSVRSNAMSTDSLGRSNEQTIARRLLAVALSDFLCWFPIGCLGLAASQGVPISAELNAAVAILVLPLNSAINPFLYTFNIMLGKRRLAKEERLYKYILNQKRVTSEVQHEGNDRVQ